MHAYQNVSRATMTGREVEAAVLTKAAQKLRDCQQHWDDAVREGRLAEAVRFNQRVWSIFQSELSRDKHELPVPIRLNLLRLSAFIDQRLLQTLAYPSAQKLEIVIRINENIAAGLRGSPADE
jgi:flagellar protein FlaF